MRAFHLERHHDDTGISGIGKVAEGCQFSDGRVALRWLVGEHRSTVVWDSIDSVEHIHGHNGHTTVVWDAPLQVRVNDIAELRAAYNAGRSETVPFDTWLLGWVATRPTTQPDQVT
jgi:hypothetical protein